MAQPAEQLSEGKKYYLFRSCRGIPLENDVVGMGWDEVKFCEFDDAEQIIQNISQVKEGNVGRRANQIRRFKSIRKDDVVVVPYIGGTVAIGFPVGNELHDPKYRGQDGCNQHRVRFLRDASG